MPSQQEPIRTPLAKHASTAHIGTYAPPVSGLATPYSMPDMDCGAGRFNPSVAARLRRVFVRLLGVGVVVEYAQGTLRASQVEH